MKCERCGEEMRGRTGQHPNRVYFCQSCWNKAHPTLSAQWQLMMREKSDARDERKRAGGPE